MAKKHSPKPWIRQREATPLYMKKGMSNDIVLMCPYCHPTHELSADKPAPCGTTIEVRAVQTIYVAKYIKKFVCVKCRQGGGEMVKFHDAYIHTHDCAPGVLTLTTPPVHSKLAAWAHDKIWVRPLVEKIFGTIFPQEEVLPDGTRTGKVMGYFFYRGTKNVRKSEHTETPA